MGTKNINNLTLATHILMSLIPLSLFAAQFVVVCTSQPVMPDPTDDFISDDIQVRDDDILRQEGRSMFLRTCPYLAASSG